MDRDERLDLMDRLQRENAEARERIAEREQRRQSDPDWLLADARVSRAAHGLHYGEPIGASPVRRNGNGALVFKTIEEALVRGSEPGTLPSDAEAWMAGHLNILRNELREYFKGTTAEVIKRREHRIAALETKTAKLEAANAELRGKLDAALAIIAGSTAIAAENGLKKTF